MSQNKGFATHAITGKPISVLLVEDTAAARELILDIFDDSTTGNFSLTVKIRVKDAQLFLQQNHVDLIILDLGLPDSNGLETLTSISTVADATPIIVLTGNDDKDLGRKAIALGAQDFIVKGFGAESLLPRIAYYTIERHKAHHQAVQAELFLRASIDSLPSRIAIVNDCGTTLFLNRAWTKTSNNPTEKLAEVHEGADYFTTCLPHVCSDLATVERLRQMAHDVLEKKTTFIETEYQHTSANSVKWYQVRMTPLLNTMQNSVVISHEDISARKRIAIDLFRSREYLRVIFDTTPNLVFVKDDQGRYIMVNKAMGSMYGLKPNEIVGKTDAELFQEKHMVEDECQNFNQDDLKVLTTNKPLTIEEEPWTSHLGKKHWFRTSKMPIQFPDCPPYVLGISTDISEQRENQDKIRSSELLLRTILDALQYRILLLDTEMQVIWANSAAKENAHEIVSSIMGQSCRDICNTDKHCRICPAEQALRTGEMHFSEVKADNGTTTLEITTIPIKNNDGEVTSIVYIAEDISQQLSVEQQLRQAQKMESLGVLAGGIAHDFNNVLTAVLGFTELALYKTKDNDSLTGDLKEVYQASIRARDLVNQILTFSRRIDKQFQPLDISLIVKEAMKLLRSTLPTSIHMDFHLEKDLDLTLADPTHIHQIIMNLCTNAAHAMQRDGGRLSVSLRSRLLQTEEKNHYHNLQPGKYIELSVTDTGHGIAEDTLPYIFDPYFTTKGLGEGTGLGLAVVHGIVKECGGDIHVVSKIGEGTTFTLLFPVVEQHEQPAVLPQTERSISNGAGYSILVVDDEPAIVKLCRRMLEAKGFTVLSETDPRAALTRISDASVRIDLLLSDLTMPHMTGDKLAQAVHEIAPTMPVILMSGNKAKADDFTGRQLPVQFIDKPLNNQELYDLIDQMLAIS
ncbi:response regulator [Desulfopila aestuarii]|uniref:histidine kinase n=1 Tax=Desulfopila aestuarii DSM 18488 TaxID=1121416 RepID=A0A1M7YJW8_9BACT|nr:response regulator [Desulfopila aestuarii]SHO52914.1 PAS domain S-box-containing protein [Desulfopila aestuarii DSM 18488]